MRYILTSALLVFSIILCGCIETPSEEAQIAKKDDVKISIWVEKEKFAPNEEVLFVNVSIENIGTKDVKILPGFADTIFVRNEEGIEFYTYPPNASYVFEYILLKKGENRSYSMNLKEMQWYPNYPLDQQGSFQIYFEHMNISSNNFSLTLDEVDPLVDIIPPVSLPSMVVAHINNITRYRYDGEIYEFIDEITIEAKHPRSLIDKDGHYYFVVNNGIRKVDQDLEQVSEMYMENMGVMVEEDGIFYFSANGSFYTCNSDLEILSALDLNITTQSGAKIVHDIIIHENVAFLVDNFYYPIYILKVNVTDPTNISVIQRIEVMGVNQHLYHQWLDIENDRWMIIQNRGIISGTYQEVLFYSMNNGTEINDHNTYWRDRHNQNETGQMIRSILPIDPTWCMVVFGLFDDITYQLSHISIENDEIGFEVFLDLHIKNETYSREGTNLEQIGDIIYASVENNLRLVDLDGTPEIIYTQTLDYYISDILIISGKK